MLQKLYPYRFSIFLLSQLVILFGSLLIPSGSVEGIILSVFFIVNVVSGILLISKQKRILYIFAILLGFLLFNFIFNLEAKSALFVYLKMVAYFMFYGLVTVQIIKQVWQSKIVNNNTIFGLISGYISLGLIGFFICIAIEITNPGAFKGVNLILGNADSLTEQLMYYSYVTLLTIGYGDIVPTTPLAQRASILVGLMGQIYLVVVTAIVVGKYVNQLNSENHSK